MPGDEDDGQTFVSQTYNDTKNRLYKKLSNSNSTLLSLAESMHSNLFINGNYVTNLVDSYYIVGKIFLLLIVSQQLLQEKQEQLKLWDIPKLPMAMEL